MMQRGERLRVRVRKRVCRVGNVYGYFEFCGGGWARSSFYPHLLSPIVEVSVLFIYWPLASDT